VSDYTNLFNTLYTQHHDLNIIMTVSPVRHLRDNPHENQVSKAHLLTAINILQETFPQLYYFPSYEIVMDELRDYRFYNDDMVHPSSLAVKYIWERFIAACINERSSRFINRMKPILIALGHRILNSSAESTHSFARSHLNKIDALKKEFGDISFSDEITYFRSLIKK
jgi:hypothetical protein